MSSTETFNDLSYEKELKFEQLVSVYFRVTLFISGIFMFLGFILFSLKPETTFSFTSITITTIMNEVMALTPIGYLFIGITILLLTPMGRVLMLFFYYLMNDDHRLMICSGIVFIFMLIGMIFNIKG